MAMLDPSLSSPGMGPLSGPSGGASGGFLLPGQQGPVAQNMQQAQNVQQAQLQQSQNVSKVQQDQNMQQQMQVVPQVQQQMQVAFLLFSAEKCLHVYTETFPVYPIYSHTTFEFDSLRHCFLGTANAGLAAAANDGCPAACDDGSSAAAAIQDRIPDGRKVRSKCTRMPTFQRVFP